MVVRGYIPDLINYSKVDVEDYLSSIGEYNNSDEDMFNDDLIKEIKNGKLFHDFGISSPK